MFAPTLMTHGPRLCKEMLAEYKLHRRTQRKFKKEVAEGKRSGIFDPIYKFYDADTFLKKLRCLFFGKPWIYRQITVERPLDGIIAKEAFESRQEFEKRIKEGTLY